MTHKSNQHESHDAGGRRNEAAADRTPELGSRNIEAEVSDALETYLETLEEDASEEALHRFVSEYKEERRGKQFTDCLSRAAFLAWSLQQDRTKGQTPDAGGGIT